LSASPTLASWPHPEFHYPGIFDLAWAGYLARTEYGDTAYSIVSGFATGAGNNFTVSGPEIGRDSLLVGASTTVIWNERFSTYIFYDGEVARTNYESHNVSGGVRITF
jgi:uncharacterized protein with beta-barrel porin domain